MYIPIPYVFEDPKVIAAFMHQFDFAAIVSHSDAAGLVASHVPVLIRESGSELHIVGHVARGNSHWRLMQSQAESMVIAHTFAWRTSIWRRTTRTRRRR